MDSLLVNSLVAFWDMPLAMRKLFTNMGTYIVTHSSNRRCTQYIDSIEEACLENKMSITDELKKDIINSFIEFGASPNEYFLYGFHLRDRNGRDEFLTDAYRTQLQKKIIGLDLFKKELTDKYNFYLLNKAFFKRECIKVTSETSFDEFYSFVKKFGRVFLKLNSASFGLNAHIIEFKDKETLKENFRDLGLDKEAEWIAEELIVQSPSMGIWNSSSVNTIRMPSFLNKNGEITIYRPFIRTGRAGAAVDNAGAGGIFAVIDEKTGKILTDGADEHYHRYKKHPDSNNEYLGWQIPRWEELVQLTKLAHRNMPRHKYIAYDFALTDEGWVMVEGNWGQYVCQQTATQEGSKKRFKALMKE